MNAAFGYARNDSGDFFGNVFTASDIVKEEKRFCAAANNVVYAHCNAVDTDGIVLILNKCELKLCSYAVGAAYEYGLFHSLNVKLEKAAEAAYVRANARGHCSCDMLFHEFYSLVSGGNINTGGCVAFRF